MSKDGVRTVQCDRPSLLGWGAILDPFMRMGLGIVACKRASVVRVYRVSWYGAEVCGNIVGWYVLRTKAEGA